MNLHEYQAKQLFAEYGLPVSRSVTVDSAADAAAATKSLGGNRWVVKAQVHAGGRGKSGGVKVVESAAEAEAFAKHWLGRKLVTYQTGADGQPVGEFWSRKLRSKRTLSRLVWTVPRAHTYSASTEGAFDIRKVASETPDRILRPADRHGAQAWLGRELVPARPTGGKQAVPHFSSVSRIVSGTGPVAARNQPAGVTKRAT